MKASTLRIVFLCGLMGPGKAEVRVERTRREDVKQGHGSGGQMVSVFRSSPVPVSVE